MFGRKKEIRLTNHDARRRLFLRRFWLKRILIAALFRCTNIAMLFKQAATLGTDVVFFRGGSRSLPTSRCLLTGRSKAVSLTFGLSRFALRSATNLGYIDGLSRTSW